MSDKRIVNLKNETHERIHEFISSYIIASGLSNSELGRRCGVDRATVGRWLKTGSISISNFLTLCKVLGISQESFFEAIDARPEETSSIHKKKKIIMIKIEALSAEDDSLLNVIDKLLS